MRISEVAKIKLPKALETEVKMLVKSGYFKNESEFVSEAIRNLLLKYGSKKVDVAARLYERGEISLGKAAEIVGVTYSEMKEELAKRGIEIRKGPSTVEEAKEDYKILLKTL
ncbi:MAG: UPF0175 family protein [Candidatus Hydrothermarchaeota archaeon]|nr:UPF0175 family protein [Candidatus Hydrothermarchaeota archaeon]